MKILLIEDDESITVVVKHTLVAYHYALDAVTDGEQGWAYINTFEYDLIILDVMLPKLDGIRFCQKLRAAGYTTPVLLLTSQNTSLDKVTGLDAGADDYMVKPFDAAELTARIRALLRRGSANPSPLLICGDLVLNPSTCEVRYRNQLLTLTTKEYELIELFLRNGQQVFGADEILDHIWSSEEFPVEATVRSHIRRLRKKLGTAGAPSDFIATVHGRGYYLNPAADSPSADNSLESWFNTQADLPSNTNAALPVPVTPPATLSPNQTAYLAVLNATWQSHHSHNLALALELRAAIQKLSTDLSNRTLVATEQASAHYIAHKLAGTLGTFGLMTASQTARNLEQALKNSLLPTQMDHLMEWAIALTTTIEQTTQIEAAPLLHETAPFLWVIAPPTDWREAVVTIAQQQGFRVATAETAHTLPPQSPSAILVQRPQLPSAAPGSDSADWFVHFTTQNPDIPANTPVVVVGNPAALAERLGVVRRGATLWLNQTAPAMEAIAAVQKLLSPPSQNFKVIVVDDDRLWLKMVPDLLNPWGLKVSTLDNCQHLWDVLETVQPDALVLDVMMPKINGIELCQMLRHDFRWQHLPILLLSVATDPQTQQQAFAAGADDYLCKPVVAAELAYRIQHRLQRVKSE